VIVLIVLAAWCGVALMLAWPVAVICKGRPTPHAPDVDQRWALRFEGERVAPAPQAAEAARR
jgi:hypothetical protein